MNLSHRFRHTVFAWLPFLGICFLVINHAIGVMGLNSEIHKQDFENISWLNLLLSFILVFVFQRPLHNRLLLFAVLAFCIGMIAEMLGVNTTFPFGSYYYTEKFGPQILGVPVIIGINWVLLSYCCGNVTDRYIHSKWLKVLSASALMLALDLLLEPFAIRHSFWVWENGVPPLQNYISWFVVSLPIQYSFQYFLTGSRNSISLPYIIILALFLVADLLAAKFW